MLPSNYTELIIQNQNLSQFEIFKNIISISIPTLWLFWSIGLLLMILIGLTKISVYGKRKMIITSPNYLLALLLIYSILAGLILLTTYYPFLSYALNEFIVGLG